MSKTKIIIAGGRDFIVAPEHIDFIDEKLESLGLEMDDVEFVTGMSNGADQIPYFYERLGYKIKEFPADWKDLDVERCNIKYNSNGTPYNAIAGHNRNKDMAEYSDMLIAFNTGGKGTSNMIRHAKKYNLKVVIVDWQSTI